MRELKFRAWDKSVEHLYEVQTLIDGGGVIGRYVLNGEMNYIQLCADEVIIEQYTGLKDKNGKEIYEGDIVLNTYYDDNEMYMVLWVNDSVAFGMESLDDMELYKLPLESLEVIGNIHENPELIEKEEE